MRRLLIALAAASLIASPATAESLLTVGSVILCESSASVGFSWKNGAWHSEAFRPGDKYLLRKVTTSECPTPAVPFGDEEEGSTANFVLLSSRICVKYSKFGDDVPKYGNQCYEIISGPKNGEITHEVICNDYSPFVPYIIFSPNGFYHLTAISDDLSRSPKNDYKDSMFVEWGLCSAISGQ